MNMSEERELLGHASVIAIFFLKIDIYFHLCPDPVYLSNMMEFLLLALPQL